MSSLDQIQNIFAYALGFSVGIIVGMKIEENLRWVIQLSMLLHRNMS